MSNSIRRRAFARRAGVVRASFVLSWIAGSTACNSTGSKNAPPAAASHEANVPSVLSVGDTAAKRDEKPTDSPSTLDPLAKTRAAIESGKYGAIGTLGGVMATPGVYAQPSASAGMP